MNADHDSDLHTWADRLEEAIANAGARNINRVRVVARTDSTQDAASAAAGGRPGLVVVAGRQSRGRGRLGRAWADDLGLGVAMSVVLGAAPSDGLLALRAGLAACGACESALGRTCGLRWPNDVLEPAGNRKVAGVLIEARDGLMIVGLGINVAQRPSDWPPALASTAVSLAQLGAAAARIDIACSLIAELEHALAATPAEIVAAWRARDRLIGRDCSLAVGRRRLRGRVLDIDPAGELAIRRDDGVVEHIPAAQVSLEHTPDER